MDIILTVAAGGEAATAISDRQLQAAIAAAPYLHARLSAVAIKDMTPPDPLLVQRQAEARAQLIASLEALARPDAPVSDRMVGTLLISRGFTKLGRFRNPEGRRTYYWSRQPEAFSDDNDLRGEEIRNILREDPYDGL